MDDSQAAFEANEADAQEQRRTPTAPAPRTPRPTRRRPWARSPAATSTSALASANEADLAEQAQEVPYDDDFEQ